MRVMCITIVAVVMVICMAAPILGTADEQREELQSNSKFQAASSDCECI
jgi:hypothetical protein